MKKYFYKIKAFIRMHFATLIIFTVLYFGLTWRLPYSIYTPGSLIDISTHLSSESKSKGSFNLTYVKSVQGTIPTILLSYIIPTWDLVSDSDVVYEAETIVDSYKRDVISLYESISNAIGVAYNEANVDPGEVDKYIYVIYKEPYANSTLKVGDRIISIDNKKITDAEEILEILDSKKIGDKISLLVTDGEKELTREATLIDDDGKPRMGLILSTIRDYKDTVTYNYKNNESGPSGGLMISLSIYDYLTDEDITKGRKISGTGTISYNGLVGEIGGVKYKLAGAVKNKADIFIAPSGDNYEEAKKIIEENNYKIKLIEGINFKQVLEELSK